MLINWMNVIVCGILIEGLLAFEVLVSGAVRFAEGCEYVEGRMTSTESTMSKFKSFDDSAISK